jgi:PAS domain S-box-containing protein
MSMSPREEPEPSNRPRPAGQKPVPAAEQSAEQRLRLILQNITDYAIFTIDPNGFVTEWHEGAERIKGWKAEEIIGQHVSTFYTPEQIASGAVDRELKEATESGRAEREDWRVRKGGERFWGNEIATAMHDDQGKSSASRKSRVISRNARPPRMRCG